MPLVRSHLQSSLAFLKSTLFGVAATVAVLSLPACSQKSQSIADYIATICAQHFRDASREEAPFLADNVSAMSKMMVDMDIKLSGDVDRDFVAMMAPHHQAAIEMAEAELRYGHNERLRRMAQEIIVTQQQEIAAMRLIVGESPSLGNRSSITGATAELR
jgi:uncharacterized protein (DUF305 family)